MKPIIAIGIDPGTRTGIASWNCREKFFEKIDTVMIHQAMDIVMLYMTFFKDAPYSVYVRVEDARKRKFYGKMTMEADDARKQGVGSIKRDCSIWEDFLKDKKIPFEMVAPKRLMTKVSSDYFKHLTGYTGKTSEHARDAAMQVYDF